MLILATLAEVAVDPLPTPEPTVIAAGVTPGERPQRPDRATVSRIVEAASILPGRWRRFGTCVERRESGGRPDARNPHSSAQGLFQFLDNAWRNGLAHMVAERLHRQGMPWSQALAIREWLRARPIASWPALYQRVGFAEVIERGGWRHWSGPGCNRLAVGR